MWDILIRARMSPHLVLADIQKAFLQVGLNEEDRDAFRFLFNINNHEQQHFTFARIPFGAEASPFILGATINYHLDRQPDTLETTVQAPRQNTSSKNWAGSNKKQPTYSNLHNSPFTNGNQTYWS
jgi:hypothetical protein